MGGVLLDDRLAALLMELVGWSGLAGLLTGMMGWAVDGAGSEDSLSFEFFFGWSCIKAFVATPFCP